SIHFPINSSTPFLSLYHGTHVFFPSLLYILPLFIFKFSLSITVFTHIIAFSFLVVAFLSLISSSPTFPQFFIFIGILYSPIFLNFSSISSSSLILYIVTGF